MEATKSIYRMLNNTVFLVTKVDIMMKFFEDEKNILYYSFNSLR